MEAKTKKNENRCECKEGKEIKSFCSKCKVYLCEVCHVAKHIDHEADVEDLAEKCTRILADFQKLSRAATLIADRRQVHIQEESIESIVGDIKGKINRAKDALQKDIAKSTDMNVTYLAQCPLVQEFTRKKNEFAGKLNVPLTDLKTHLSTLCKDLLKFISEGKYESADKLVSLEDIKKHEEEIKAHCESSACELEFIQEIRKLKQTVVDYSYDPMAILGMVKVATMVKKPNRVVQFDREKNELNIYNAETNTAATTKITSGFILPFRFVSTEACNNLYLCGGDNDHSQYLKSFYVYDELRGCLIPLASMKTPRSRHALAAVEVNHQIYAIGGESDDGVLRTCEVFEIKENEWKPAPKLAIARCGLSTCVIDGTKIYAVGGWNQEYLDTIELLDLDGDKKWEVLKLAKGHHLKPIQAPGVVELNDKTMMVFGGYKEKEELTTECWLVDTSSKKVSKAKEMPEKEAFVASEVKIYGGKVFAFGYSKGGLHSYDVAKDEWTFVAQDKIPH